MITNLPRTRTTTPGRLAWMMLGCLSIATASGCVERRYTIRSDPPGALVVVNGDEIGPAPVSRNFIFYGYRDIRLQREGYEPLKVFGWLAGILLVLSALAWSPFLYDWILNGDRDGHLQSIVVGGVLLVAAVQAFALGVIADLIAAHRIVSQRTLERGYALVTTPSGDPLAGAGAIRTARAFDIRMADGAVAARVDEEREGRPDGRS